MQSADSSLQSAPQARDGFPQLEMTICAVVLGLLLASTVHAQTLPAESGAQIRRTVELVNVDVAVTDARGRFRRDLTERHFRILDNAVPQPITHFASVEAPAIVLVLVETSPAVYLLHRQHLMAAHALLDGLAADDQVALATYDATARVVMGFTSDKNRLRGAMNSLTYGLGVSALNLYDGVSTAVDWLAAVPGKKAIVLLSTGLDPAPAARWEALSDKLAANDVSIFAVGLGGDLREFRKQMETSASGTPLSFERASETLRQMAGSTGGRAFFPKSAKEVPEMYRELALTLRHRYSLAFTPPARDGARHEIIVEVLDDRGNVVGASPAPQQRQRYRVYARRGYIAPAR